MQEGTLRRGFVQGEPPKVMAMILCDQVSLPVAGAQKPTYSGVFDMVTAPENKYPFIVGGYIVVLLSGVREEVRVRVEIVAYTADNPIGVRHTVGVAEIKPPDIGTIQAAIFGNAILIPATEPGTAEMMVYCNDTWLDMRPIYVRAAEPPPEATT